MKMFVLSLFLTAVTAMSVIEDVGRPQWKAFQVRNIVFGSHRSVHSPISPVKENLYEELRKEEWNNFKLKFNKTYDSEEEENFRQKLFTENKRKVEEHNARYENGEVKYTRGVNNFADMLPSEYRIWLGHRPRPRNMPKRGSTFIPPANVYDEESVDWREKGAVTGVKNQGRCGSCWAFSATGGLEGQTFMKTGKLVSLSEQNLIDCSGEGCNGGRAEDAFQYIEKNKGIDTEDSYPYDGQDEQCKYNAGNEGAEDTGYSSIESGDEDALKKAVASIGPISVAIDASHDSFQQYSGGIYSEPDCKNAVNQLDHAVLAVGYGTDQDGDYWLVKNSWGEQWGEQGYIKMARNQDNMCGIATDASYPKV
ncbi:hypothetical protein WDU94_012057 [Cyamophila willieti]